MVNYLARLRQQPWVAAALVIIVLFAFLRIWRLSFPAATVFDEVYFPKMAHQYLTGQSFFDIHPPLGKLMIAVGEWIFGNTTFGWRIVPLLSGLLMIPAAYWAMVQIFASRRAGLMAALLVAIDGLFIVYSRTGLMDGFMILFGLLSLGFVWQFRRRRLTGERAITSLVWTGIMAGLAVAVKWIGAGFLPVVAGTALLTIIFSNQKIRTNTDYLWWLLGFVVIPFLLYTLPFLANWQTDFWTEFVRWHEQSWNYNINLEATHPYASKWWSWPFLLRPIWFYYHGANGIVTGVDAIGNPLVWWGSTLAVVYTILLLGSVAWQALHRQRLMITGRLFYPLLFMVAGWAAFYLPWVEIGRVLFLYHYFGSYLFALLLAAFWLSQAWEGRRSRVVAIICLALAVATGLLFAPIWIAYPIPQAWFDQLMWFKSWI